MKIEDAIKQMIECRENELKLEQALALACDYIADNSDYIPSMTRVPLNPADTVAECLVKYFKFMAKDMV